MTFTWDGTVLDASGSLAPSTQSKVLEQSGQILRTITGLGYSNRVWSKWALSFSWEQSPSEVGTKLLAMRDYNGNITFEDAIMGTYTVQLTDDALNVDTTDFGVCSAQATFREV